VSEGQSIFFWKKKNKNIGEFSEKKKITKYIEFYFSYFKKSPNFFISQNWGKKKTTLV